MTIIVTEVYYKYGEYNVSTYETIEEFIIVTTRQNDDYGSAENLLALDPDDAFKHLLFVGKEIIRNQRGNGIVSIIEIPGEYKLHELKTMTIIVTEVYYKHGGYSISTYKTFNEFIIDITKEHDGRYGELEDLLSMDPERAYKRIIRQGREIISDQGGYGVVSIHILRVVTKEVCFINAVDSNQSFIKTMTIIVTKVYYKHGGYSISTYKTFDEFIVDITREEDGRYGEREDLLSMDPERAYNRIIRQGREIISDQGGYGIVSIVETSGYHKLYAL
ncbi:hypothetical protein HDU96_003190 [Phlyctochytrium bullatum]|nr:hypothetical protein HDU96_003190 [Phlyctochytrium bullatum]